MPTNELPTSRTHKSGGSCCHGASLPQGGPGGPQGRGCWCGHTRLGGAGKGSRVPTSPRREIRGGAPATPSASGESSGSTQSSHSRSWLKGCSGAPAWLSGLCATQSRVRSRSQGRETGPHGGNAPPRAGCSEQAGTSTCRAASTCCGAQAPEGRCSPGPAGCPAPGLERRRLGLGLGVQGCRDAGVQGPLEERGIGQLLRKQPPSLPPRRSPRGDAQVPRPWGQVGEGGRAPRTPPSWRLPHADPRAAALPHSRLHGRFAD